jgi:hypothetical protein
MASEAVGHVAEQFVAGVVAVLVVDGLQVVHVHEGGYKVSARPARAVDFALKLLKPDAPPSGTSQLVGPSVRAVVRGLLAVARGLLPVARGLLAVKRRALAVVRRALAALNRAGTKLLHSQGVPVFEESGAAVELERFLVANGGIVVAPRRELVALLCRCVAPARCLVAKASSLQALSRRSSAYSGGSRVGGRVDAVRAAPIGGGLVVV